MRNRLIDQRNLFISLGKWFFQATIIGIIVGGTVAVFLRALEWGIGIGQFDGRFYLLLPVSLFLSSLIINTFAADAKGHGTVKILELIHKRQGKIKFQVVPIKFIATIITIATGGSGGKANPAVLIGAGVVSMLTTIFRCKKETARKLVIYGISAGFSAVFGAPIAGAVFGLEVLFAGVISHREMIPSLIAGVVSYRTAMIMGVSYNDFIPFAEGFSLHLFIYVLIGGIFFGLCSLYFIRLLELFDRLAETIRIWEPLKGLMGGLALILLVFLFSERYLGLGEATIINSLEGGTIIWYAFLLKGLFTAITLSFGGSGGLITPIIFMGVTAGAAFAQLFNLDISFFAAIGMVSLLAGAANAPLACSVLAVELFGFKIVPYAAVSCIIAFLITGHSSVYPYRILGIRNSMSLIVDYQEEDEKVDRVKR